MNASEIKCRAKVLNSNNWIYGQPFHIRGTWYMYNSSWNMIPIQHKTLGRYTGLKDKNDEGDIVEFNNCDYDRTGGYLDDEIVKGKVAFTEGRWTVKTKKVMYDLYLAIINDEELEIIGNIHE